jgi:hypothetical protein
MKVQIPEQLKADVPQTNFGKILSATPVIMAVLSTMLAGLASSEMTRGQYGRSLAAQQQSKAGDQWSFFQAKRLRGAVQRNTVDLLFSMGGVSPFNAAAFKAELDKAAEAGGAELKGKLTALLSSAPGQQTMALLESQQLPALPPVPEMDSNIKAAEAAVEDGRPESEIASLLARVSDKSLEQALRASRDHANAVDDITKPINDTLENLHNLLARNAILLHPAGSSEAANPMREFTAARLRYAADRYDTEARINQGIANLYELQVRKSNILAERHRNRSQRFFFGMLGAQTGVIISTLAMAARKRNLLWALAAAAGGLALAFAIYVYLYV